MRLSPRKVLLVAHDRGGVNLLAPLLMRWRSEDSSILPTFLGTPMIQQEMESIAGFGKVQSTLEGSEQLAVRPVQMSGRGETFVGRSAWTFSDEDLRCLLTEAKWDLVLTGTSAVSTMEKAVWRVCRDLGVPCAAICDMWTEYELRLTNPEGELLVDNLLVLDDRMAREVEAALKNSPNIAVVGSPHFSALLDSRKSQDLDRRYIRFISEPVAALFPKARVHEFQIAELLIETLRATGEQSTLLLRPHPQDDSEGWRRFAHKYLDWGVKLDTEPSWMCPVTTKAAIGLSSMMLIELALAGIPVASYQPWGSDSSYFCLPEVEFGISVIGNDQELAAWLRNFVPPHVEPAFVEWHKCAIDRISELVSEGRLLS